MVKYRSSSISSKWLKTQWLVRQKDLRNHVPRTLRFNKHNLKSMLSAYSTVYFKPTSGSGGFNIVRIKKWKGGYQTQYNRARTTYSTLDRLYAMLSRFSKKRSFLLQKGIHLARTNGRPFDIRVMVQKTNKGAWLSTAIITKVGKPGKVATNYHQGGKLKLLRPTLSGAGYNRASIQHMEAKLKRLGVSVGKNFARRRKGFRELGLDVALDSKRKPWILEVNTRPEIYPIRKMRNKTLYRRIIFYAKQYGRYK